MTRYDASSLDQQISQEETVQVAYEISRQSLIQQNFGIGQSYQ